MISAWMRRGYCRGTERAERWLVCRAPLGRLMDRALMMLVYSAVGSKWIGTDCREGLRSAAAALSAAAAGAHSGRERRNLKRL